MLLQQNLEFPSSGPLVPQIALIGSLADQLASFRAFGKATQIVETSSLPSTSLPLSVPTYVNEFWTSKQRAASSLQEVSYRACFKPQLPRFFIERLTQPGDVVHDPFMGRGTTIIEAALMGRVPYGNDANPLSIVMARPRLRPPALPQVATRLHDIRLYD